MSVSNRISARDCVMVAIGVVVALLGAFGTAYVKNSRTPLRVQQDKLTIAWLPATVKHWQPQIVEMAKKYNIDPDLLAIIMTIESGGNAKAHSEADAEGLMQVTPLTAQDIATKYLKQPQKSYDLMDAKTSIEFGAAYLSFLRNEFGAGAQGPSWNNTVELLAAGYNGGPGAANSVEQGKGLRDTQTVVYSRDVFNMWRERHASKSPTYERWVERGGSALIDAAKASQQ